MEFDRVIFRRWRKAPGTVIAILPDVPANPGRVMMYEHIGQHGEGDYYGVLVQTKPARLSEPDTAALFRELTQRGYNLAVRVRLPHDRNQRREA